MMILSLLLITLLIIASPYRLGKIEKKLVYRSFNGDKRYFLVVNINGELCDFEVDSFQIRLFRKFEWVLVNTVTYQNSKYIKTIVL